MGGVETMKSPILEALLHSLPIFTDDKKGLENIAGELKLSFNPEISQEELAEKSITV
jgi:hypothetical protein